jgi:hypothetical protein
MHEKKNNHQGHKGRKRVSREEGGRRRVEGEVEREDAGFVV